MGESNGMATEKIQQYLSQRTELRQLLLMDELMRKDLAISRVDAERYAGRYKLNTKKRIKERATDERNQLAGV